MDLNSDVFRRLSLFIFGLSLLLSPVMYRSLPSCVNGVMNGTSCDCIGPAYGGSTCADMMCVNGLPTDDGLCECVNLWHGDHCDVCNSANDDGPCVLPCFAQM